ncbi:hypothetical protein B0H14DRAFT_2568230 [Mycena olivaceomarginata]|nr:hypothetical protein B0H14DRAFT_2568230 [Mycena olivaceomarginata]
MYSKPITVSVALLALVPSTSSAPLPAPAASAHSELEARLSFPSGALGSIIKSLGTGILTGGAFTGLLGLLGEHGDSDAAPAQNAARALLDLETRGGLGALLGKIVGVGEETLESVLKKAVIGGAATGKQRRGIPVSIAEDGVKAEKGIGSVIGDGLASGVGSAVGGLGIGAILSKFFGGNDSGKRALADLSDEEVNALLEYVSVLQNHKRALADLSDEEVNSLLEYVGDLQHSKRAPLQLGSAGKGISGLVAGLAATQGVEAAIEKIKDLFKREISLNDLD